MIRLAFIFAFVGSTIACSAQEITIKNDPANKTVLLGNRKMRLALGYGHHVNVSELTVNGEKVIEGAAGVYSEIKTKAAVYSTLHLLADPIAKVARNTLVIDNIVYGDKDLAIRETWKFRSPGIIYNCMSIGPSRNLR